jgi:chromatin structure-remodeling complex protein RSC7
MLNREWLNEENWLVVAAQRTAEAGEQWAKIRREALKVCGGILTEGAAKADESPTGEDVGVASKEGVGDVTRKGKRQRVSILEGHGGLAVGRVRASWRYCAL